MEMQNIAVNNQINPRDQAGQVLSLSRNHINKIDDMPFIDNYDHLNALKKEALLILVLSALRHGKTDWSSNSKAADRLFSALGLSFNDFNVENIQTELHRIQQINQARQDASLQSGIKLFFPAFCSRNNLDAFDQKILLLLFMNVTSERFRETFSLCQFEEDKKGIQIRIILSCLCSGYRDQLEKRTHFSRNAPLVSREIIFFHHAFNKQSNSHLIDEIANINERHIRYIIGDGNLYNSTYKEISIEKSSIKLDKVIMPSNTKDQIVLNVERYLHQRKRNKASKLDEFLEYGTALTMLFQGPSGTGKTMLAKALAHHFNRPLITVKVDETVYRWHLEYLMIQAFREAAMLNGFVFFDEADDLFKEGSYLSRMLLIQIEKARCIVIFATNKGGHIDPAMERRLSLKIHFPLPDNEQRLKIWQALIPDFVRLAPDVDLKALNNRYPFSGGLIKNTIFLAANSAETDSKGNHYITRQLLEQAADAQTKQMVENDKFCTTYAPVKTIDNLPLIDKQRTELKNMAQAFQYAKQKGLGLNILFSGVFLETCVHAADALAAECGLKVKAFKYGDLDTLCKDNELKDGVTHEKVNLIDYAFSQTTEEAHLLLIVDYNGSISWNETGKQNDMENNLSVKTGVAAFLNKLRDYRGLCCLVMPKCPTAHIPLEFHAHLKLEYPTEEMQMQHWESNLSPNSAKDNDVVELVERYPMHIAEIDCILHRASIQSLIEGRSNQPSLEIVKSAIARYRGQNGIPLLFGKK